MGNFKDKIEDLGSNYSQK